MSGDVSTTVTEALDKLASWDHSFLGRPEVDEIREALGVKSDVELQREVDTRYIFKGLTINRADGYLNLIEYRKWCEENKDWFHAKKGVSQTEFVDTLWVSYTQVEPDGYGLPGVPYAEGIDASDFALWICRTLDVPVEYYGGRGFQLRACVESLRSHLTSAGVGYWSSKGHLFRWSGELTEMGYQGSTEADDENEYVLSCIQRLADAFDINLDELGYGGEEEEEEE